MCCVMPPASPAATLALRILSSREVLPWSTWPMKVTTGGRVLTSTLGLGGSTGFGGGGGGLGGCFFSCSSTAWCRSAIFWATRRSIFCAMDAKMFIVISSAMSWFGLTPSCSAKSRTTIGPETMTTFFGCAAGAGAAGAAGSAGLASAASGAGAGAAAGSGGVGAAAGVCATGACGPNAWRASRTIAPDSELDAVLLKSSRSFSSSSLLETPSSLASSWTLMSPRWGAVRARLREPARRWTPSRRRPALQARSPRRNPRSRAGR